MNGGQHGRSQPQWRSFKMRRDEMELERMMRGDLPAGSVTFLFTDVEGSTRLLHELGEELYSRALVEHRVTLRDIFVRRGGVEVDTQGDACFYAFPDAVAAIAAADEAQSALQGAPVQVRMGLHTGPAMRTDDGYVGREVHRAARIAAAGHGGQVLLSHETRRLVDADVLDLGDHRLKDFAEATWLFQLGSRRFPPLNTISNTNLRRPVSTFVGRAHDVEAVLALLNGGVRLLTLTGPGGSGKTRLATEAAAELIGKLSGGVFWVSLSTVRDPALVIPSIAQSLGARGELEERIGDRELLLVLDNLEQVVEAAAEITAVIERCPRLVIVATSRELLRVRGEVEYPVLPLAEQDAVQLFCQRARQQPSGTIAELCRRLDNLPLAVELAAAATSVLSPPQIVDRLGRRLDLLKGGRDLDGRQKSLRATIAWSHELLSSEEKALFARLAVFAGDWSLAAAEAVCLADLSTLQSLIEKNLVRRLGDRFGMLETIREYAAEQLDHAGDGDVLLSKLAGYLIETVRAEGPPQFLGRQPSAFALFAREHANVRLVMDWALQQRRHDVSLELIAALFMVWTSQGHLTEAIQWAEKGLQFRGEAAEDLWTRSLVGMSQIFRDAGDLSTSLQLKEELLDRYTRQESADPLLLPAIFVNLAEFAMNDGEFERAHELAEQSLRLRVARGLSPARALLSLGELALLRDDLVGAEKLLEEAASGLAALQDEVNGLSALERLGEVARRRGDHALAARRFQAAMKRCHFIGQKPLAGECLLGLSLVVEARGDVERAARLWGAGQAVHRSAGSSAARTREGEVFPGHFLAEGATLTFEQAITLGLSASN
jgi:predicted ATPase/class 3 adenylate cyclase